jgi:glucan phosphoethanolaminetransferase (alkaline phosphatase superfamily)
VEVDDRWGGYSEQLALSKFLKIPIIVYISQKYDRNHSKIITGKISNNKAEKGVRFKTYQSTGLEFMDTSPPITLLWKKSNGDGHYLALYKKNENILFNKMAVPYVK